MQTLGVLLREAREEKGYTIDQVIHETNISRSYIENLEKEFFDDFPAEAYLVGFLRTYSNYLGLDPEKVIELYKTHKLREEPAPLEALVGKKKAPLSPLVIYSLIGAVVLIGAGIFLIPVISHAIADRQQVKQILQNAEEKRKPREITISEEVTELQVVDGDSLIFSSGEKTRKIIVTDNENGLMLKREGSAGSGDSDHFLTLGKEEFFSLFLDSPDYRIYLKDYGFSDGGGVLIIQKLNQTDLEREEQKENESLLDISEIETTAPSGVSSRTVEPVVIYTTTGGERYTLDMKFRGYSLVRYKKDYEAPIQQYYKDGDTLRVEVNSMIELWLSNAGSVYAKINGVELDFGNAGQVSAKKIQWAKNETGQYELLLLHVY